MPRLKRRGGMCMKRKIRSDLLEQVKALIEARTKEKNELEARIAEAESKLTQWTEKIETLSPTIRATVKKLLGLE